MSQDHVRVGAGGFRRPVRQRIHCGLLVRTALIGSLLVACRGEERRPAAEGGGGDQKLERTGTYAIGESVLYRMDGEIPIPLATLPGGGSAPDTLEACRPTIPDVGRASFRRLVASSDPEWVAWETGGPGACVGVASPSEPPVQVLGKWSGAFPDSVIWAPAGHYLAVWLIHPSQRRSVWVYDAVEAARLEMPWETDCAYDEDCDVERVVWQGGTLLNVGIRLGPAEASVPYEVNVAATQRYGMREEM